MVPHIAIEEAIARLFDCSSAVTSVPDEKKGERLVAFFTRKAPPAEVWERLVQTELPRLWIPKRENIFHIEEIPATATGKLDLRKLKTLAMQMSTLSQ